LWGAFHFLICSLLLYFSNILCTALIYSYCFGHNHTLTMYYTCILHYMEDTWYIYKLIFTYILEFSLRLRRLNGKNLNCWRNSKYKFQRKKESVVLSYYISFFGLPGEFVMETELINVYQNTTLFEMTLILRWKLLT
jgi:hypothetical protein